MSGGLARQPTGHSSRSGRRKPSAQNRLPGPDPGPGPAPGPSAHAPHALVGTPPAAHHPRPGPRPQQRRLCRGAGRCLVLTGPAHGPLRRAPGDPCRPERWDLSAADRCLGVLVDLLGAEDVAVEATLDGGPTDAALSEALSHLARAHHLPLLATGAVRCARPADSRLADVLAANRMGTDLEGARPYLGALGRWLRGPEDMARLHRRAPEAVEAAAEHGRALAFDLALIAPQLPAPKVPAGHTPATWLRELTQVGARRRYGTREQDPKAWEVLDHELEVIESLGFPGYFLIVRSIVDFCERSGILCQGRGSAANSAVCYALGVTAVDAVRRPGCQRHLLPPPLGGA